MKQTFSHDGGRTWTEPVQLKEGRVLPDLVLMSNGVLACSFGRPASCLMFSLDRGRTWTSHHLVSDRVRFNYTSIREISPGRLPYVRDAPKLTCIYMTSKKRVRGSILRRAKPRIALESLLPDVNRPCRRTGRQNGSAGRRYATSTRIPTQQAAETGSTEQQAENENCDISAENRTMPLGAEAGSWN